MLDYGFEHLIGDAMSDSLNKLSTCTMGVIVGIHKSLHDMSVDVEPALKELQKDGTSVSNPVIYRVPVQMPGSGTSLINIPLHIGDTVLLVFVSRSLDVWKTSNGFPSTTNNFRKFDSSDAIAIPGVFPFPKSVNNPRVRKWKHNTDDLCIAHNIGSAREVEIRLTPFGDVVVNTDSKVLVNASDVHVNATSVEIDTNTLTVSGDINHTGNFTHVGNFVNTGSLSSNTVTLDTHKHILGGNPPVPGT